MSTHYQKFLKSIVASLILFCTLSANTLRATDVEGIIPEVGSGLLQKEKVVAKEFMVTAANPHAVKAGYDIIKKGGNAIDALVAVQLVLNLVEPQSSGIGGGAFLLFYDKALHQLKTFDGRETAPAKATSELFLDENGQPLNFWDGVVGGKSVGTPGTLKILEYTHTQYGQLPWKELFEPAIQLAEEGFKVSHRLATQIKEDKFLKDSPTAAAYFFRDGQPLTKGTLLKNPNFANTLREIAKHGSKVFYEGPIGEDIINTVQQAFKNPGYLTLNDLKNYEIVERAPVCTPYKNYMVCGMAPPTSGGITVQQILGQLSFIPLDDYTATSVETIHLFSESAKLAYADRAQYIADPDYVHVPTEAMINKDYLKGRSVQIQLNSSMGIAKEGTLNQALLSQAPDESIEFPCTSHISIVDKQGNVVSMTTTIENSFGSRLMTKGGFLLNNELTDFSFSAHKDVDGQKHMIANRVEANKRPRSSMAPTIVFNGPLDDENTKPYMVIGSPGGSRIINYVAQTILAVLEWDLDIQQAINLPHYVNRNGDIELEEKSDLVKHIPQLEAKGHKVVVKPQTSGLHGILITDSHIEGGADPRREGIAMGE